MQHANAGRVQHAIWQESEQRREAGRHACKVTPSLCEVKALNGHSGLENGDCVAANLWFSVCRGESERSASLEFARSQEGSRDSPNRRNKVRTGIAVAVAFGQQTTCRNCCLLPQSMFLVVGVSQDTSIVRFRRNDLAPPKRHTQDNLQSHF